MVTASIEGRWGLKKIDRMAGSKDVPDLREELAAWLQP